MSKPVKLLLLVLLWLIAVYTWINYDYMMIPSNIVCFWVGWQISKTLHNR